MAQAAPWLAALRREGVEVSNLAVPQGRRPGDAAGLGPCARRAAADVSGELRRAPGMTTLFVYPPILTGTNELIPTAVVAGSLHPLTPSHKGRGD